MKKPKRILIRSPNWIGDQVLAYPFFYYLREMYPSAHIAVSCVTWVESVQFLHLVDEVIPLAPLFVARMEDSVLPMWVQKARALERSAVRLRERGPWDLGICLPHSFSSAWLMFRSNVTQRVGYRSDGRGFLLHQAIDGDPSHSGHRSETYVRLLLDHRLNKKPVTEFWGVPPAHDLDPGIPGVQQSFPVEKAWPNVEPLSPPSQPYWVLAPGSNADSRRWSIEKFAQLAQKVSSQKGWTGVIVGGVAERPAAARLMEDPSLKLIDWTGRGSVATYWKVFRNAKVSVCNDSGLAHVAALCGSAVQIIWGAGDPKKTEPLGPGRVRILFSPVECWPCESNVCDQLKEKNLECLKNIQPEAVWEEIQSGIRI